MPCAIELALDARTAAIVRRAWEDLAAAGFTYMAGCGARPHVSLAIWEEIDRVALERELRTLASEMAPLAVTFDRVATFPAPVVYLGPVPSAELSAFQRRAHARLGRFARAAWAHYLPDAWVPHCTLAMDFPVADVPAAVEIARRVRLSLDGRLDAIGIVEFRPVRELALYPLAGR